MKFLKRVLEKSHWLLKILISDLFVFMKTAHSYNLWYKATSTSGTNTPHKSFSLIQPKKQQ